MPRHIAAHRNNAANAANANRLHPLARSKIHQARLQFVTLLKEKHPELYRAAMERAEKSRQNNAKRTGNAATLNGLGQDGEEKSFWEKFTEGVTTLGTTYLSYKVQKDTVAINMTRAEQGLPPIDTSFAAPVVRTQIDISPEIAARLQDMGMGGMRNIALIGGAIVLAIVMMGGKRGRR